MTLSYKTYLVGTILSLMFTGCATSGHTKFYQEYPQTQNMLQNDQDRLVFLKDKEEPQVFTTDNMKRDVKKLMAKKYVLIGASSFNGELEDKDDVISQAKRLGAVAVLYSWKYVNTQTNSGVITMPQTNYFSGTVNSYGSGGTGTSTFNGSSTGMVSTPYSITQRRYDQESAYFIKDSRKDKFGIATLELTRDERINIGRYGILIDNIMEDSPTYNSNLLIGDVIIEIDGQSLQNFQQFDKLLKDIDVTKGYCDWKVIRNGQEQIVRIKFS